MTSRHPQTLRERPDHEGDSSTAAMSSLAVQNGAREEVVPARAQQHGVFGRPGPDGAGVRVAESVDYAEIDWQPCGVVWTSSPRSHL